MDTLNELWDKAKQKHPRKVAVVMGDKRLTYQRLDQSIRKLSAGLLTHWNIYRGEVVALLSPNCPEFIISYFAIVRSGGIIQPLDERLRPDEMKDILLDARPRILIVHSSLRSKFDQIRSDLPFVEKVLSIGNASGGTEQLENWLSYLPELKQDPDVVSKEAAELMYTSGTTGEPKGALRSHANVLAASRNAIRGFGYTGNDVIAIVMPMSHSSALTSQMLPLIQLGGTVVLVDRFGVNNLIETIQSERVTCLRAVPAMMRLLISSPDFCSRRLPTLRLLMNSSAPIDPETYKEIKRRFTSIRVLNSYGLTEASTCTILTDQMALIRPDSVGVPISDVGMCIMDEEGKELGAECEGEICVRGEHVFMGYRNRPGETHAVFKDGWLRTGDLGHRDVEGFYYLHGRKSEVINCGGRKFAPLEVENCILKLPEVSEVAVVGTAHRILGQVARAYVVPKNRGLLNSKQIIQHCTRNLPSHKIPFFVEMVTELPKNGVGKILHRRLKQENYER